MSKPNSKEEARSELKTITPDLARKWLDAVPDFQRKLDRRQVDKIKIAIQRNEWRLNGAAIVFNERGDLIDGQHRLTAIAESSRPVQSLVVTGISKDELTFATLGDTKPRQAADFLHVTHSFSVAAALRFIWFIENKGFPDGRRSGTSDKSNPPVTELVKLGRQYANILNDMVQPLNAASQVTGLGAFILALMWYFTYRRPKTEVQLAAEFFARVGDGVGLALHHPAYQLRRRMLDRSSGIAVIPVHIRRGMLIKALNYHLDGKACDRIVWNPDRELFPPLRGYEPPGKIGRPSKSEQPGIKELPIKLIEREARSQ